MPLVAVVLAAGKGTRMKSTLPKVLHQVGGRPMLGHVLNAVDKAGAKKKVVVAGFAGEQVVSYVGKTAEVVYQEQQLGTAHALMQAEEELRDISGHVLVVCGDTPLITSETLSKLVKAHMENGVAATVLTTKMTDPTGYGRIIRDQAGNVQRIVEQKDGSREDLAVNEINTGVYCLALDGLFSSLKEISPANAQGEYYLTDIIQLYNQKQKKVAACICDDFNEVMGINSRNQLAEAEKVLRHRVLNHWMAEGVTVIDPGSTYVDDTVTIGQDTVLYPGTILEGNTVIGKGATIGPNTRIVDAQVADNCQVQYSIVLKSSLGAGCNIGPFAYIRPDSQLGLQVKVGDFVEVKKSVVGNNTKIPHLSYIGDSVIGREVNIGAGTITCNYDGQDKHLTKIEDHAFVGSNANLVAPVVIGDHAVIAAGSTITEDVPAGSLALARERQINKEDWAKKNSKY